MNGYGMSEKITQISYSSFKQRSKCTLRRVPAESLRWWWTALYFSTHRSLQLMVIGYTNTTITYLQTLKPICRLSSAININAPRTLETTDPHFWYHKALNDTHPSASHFKHISVPKHHSPLCWRFMESDRDYIIYIVIDIKPSTGAGKGLWESHSAHSCKVWWLDVVRGCCGVFGFFC